MTWLVNCNVLMIIDSVAYCTTEGENISALNVAPGIHSNNLLASLNVFLIT